MTKTIYDITIIGGGPVGLWTAFYAGLRGMTVNIIESLSELGGQPAILYPEKKIYDIPAFPVLTGSELTENLLQQLTRFEETTIFSLKEEVQTFEKREGIFHIQTDKAEHLSRAIIIACGNGAFAPRLLGVNDEELYADQSLFYNVRQLEQFTGKNVVIFGGGDSAVDWANALESIAANVTVVHRRDSFRAHEHSVDVMKSSRINLLTPYIPVAISGKDGQVSSVTVQKVKEEETVELAADAIIVSFGFATNNKNLKHWNVDYKRTSIHVSQTYQTSQEGVFAIGDAADYDGKVELIATGFGEAPIAVNEAIKYAYPNKDNRPVHSTSLITE